MIIGFAKLRKSMIILFNTEKVYDYYFFSILFSLYLRLYTNEFLHLKDF